MYWPVDWYIPLIQKYGYLAAAIGTLLQDETSLALGGLCARQELLSPWPVILFAVTGSFTGHCGFYLLGRWRGPALVNRFRKLREGYPQVQALAQRFGPACIFVVQFLCGLRLSACFVLGTLGLKPRIFIQWQLISISCWALSLTLIGYLMGAAFDLIGCPKILATLVALVIAVISWAYSRFWRWAGQNARLSLG